MSRTNLRRPPAKPKRKLWNMWRKHTIWLSGVTAILILAGGTGFWLNRELSVTHWDISAPAELIRPIEQQLIAMPKLDFLHSRPASVRTALMQSIPDIAEVHVKRILPDALYIQAHARVPIALWQDEDGAIRLVDRHGHAYRETRFGEIHDLPVLRLPQQYLAKASALLITLRQQDAGRYAHISELASTHDSWKLYFERGQYWMIPHTAEAMQQRVKNLIALLSQPRWRNKKWRVDARMETRWFIRPAKQEGVI
ncbi:MAG: cell division protein FtsQ/DivIB [Mariprofundaceae bacterium]